MSKFDSPEHEAIYALTLDSTEEQIGDVDTCTWQALVLDMEYTDVIEHAHAIVSVDSLGFVDVETFHVQWMAQRAWRNVLDCHEKCCTLADDPLD